MYVVELEGEEVSIVIYSQEFSTNVLGISKKDVEKYGLPRALKYKNCDLLIPIPNSKSVYKMFREMKKINEDLSPEQISGKLAMDFFK